jgi:hypothetical protein
MCVAAMWCPINVRAYVMITLNSKELYSFGITLKRQSAIECWPVHTSEPRFTCYINLAAETEAVSGLTEALYIYCICYVSIYGFM